MEPRRLEELQTSFDELAELDASERGERLATLTSSDPDLRRALEALLAADAQASTRLAFLEAGVLLQLGSPPIDPLGLAGRTISHFEVHELLGAGGMGAVYRAEDIRLGRAVALKFLLPPYNLDAAAKTRFLREAHSAAALDHPNLCSLHEVGTSDDGHLFLAMTLYRGETVKSRLAMNGPLPVSQVIDIARQVAQGLEAAHAAGIVHRDLKPANVMLLPPPDGTVKILDFGLAKARDQSLSETGARFGTVSYMAPEQIQGEKVDARSDLWALGVVIYEMLTQRKPFGGEEEIAIAHAILCHEPIPPSTHRTDVPASVEDLVLRLLHKDPARRYASAAELLGDIARLGAITGVHHAVRQRVRRASRMLSRRGRRMATVGAVILLIVAGGYAGVLRNAAPTPVPARTAIAVLPFRNLSADQSHSYLADALQDEILTQLSRSAELNVIGRSSVMSYGGANAPPLRKIAQDLRVGTIVEGSVQVVGNRMRVNVQLRDPLNEQSLWVDTYDRTLDDVFAIQSDIARQIVATVGAALSGGERNALAQVPTSNPQAYLLYLEGKEYERRPGYRRENLEAAARLYDQALALHPSFALAHAALSMNHGYMYWMRYDMSADRLARQLAEAESALKLAPDMPQAHEAMGKFHNVGPDTDVREGLKEFRIALRVAPNDSRLWRWVASAHRRLGNWDQYDEAFEKAVQLDPRDVDLLADYGGFSYKRMGRYADAIRSYDRASSLVADPSEYSIEKAWLYMQWQGQMDTLRVVMNGEPGRIFRRSGRIGPHIAFRFIERQPDSVLQLLKEVTRPVLQGALIFHPKSLYAGWAHEMRGDPEAARAAFDSALATIDSAIKQFPDDWPVHHARGLALAGLGRRAEALSEVGKLRENFIYRKDLFLRPYVVIGAAQILARAGQADAALYDLEGLLSDRAPAISIHELRLMPIWAPIHEHPRFQAMLTKYGAEPGG